MAAADLSASEEDQYMEEGKYLVKSSTFMEIWSFGTVQTRPYTKKLNYFV